MQFQSKLSQSVPEILQEPICVRLVLESQDDIIRIADDSHLAVCPFLAPHVHPEIESVVQVDIREKR